MTRMKIKEMIQQGDWNSDKFSGLKRKLLERLDISEQEMGEQDLLKSIERQLKDIPKQDMLKSIEQKLEEILLKGLQDRKD